MIRGALLATALLAATTMTAQAEIVFVGTIKFTAKTPQCARDRVNQYANSVFHPASVGGNANFAGLSWVWSHYARAHSVSPGNFTTAFRVVQTGGSGWGDPFILPAARQSQIRITSSVPPVASITATTPTLTLTGQIRRFSDDPGGLLCVYTFTGNYVKDSTQ